MIQLKKRTAVRIAAFSAALVLTLAGMIWRQYEKQERYRLKIENSYSKNLDELTAGVNNISLLLQKAKYSNSAYSLSDTSSQLIAEAQTAKNALSALPGVDTELSALGKFLSQVGNYAVSVSRSMITEGVMTDEQREDLSRLSVSADKIAQAIEGASTSFNNPEYWAKQVDAKIDETVSEDSLAQSLTDLEKDMDDAPTLVYDGPYSDHIMQAEVEMIRDAPEVTREHARSVAAAACGCEETELKFLGEDSGKIPAYHFGSGDCDITVSRAGGYPVYMRKVTENTGSVLDYDQVRSKAKRYLAALIQGSFTETYYYTDEGVCVISFAYVDGETVCYTDLIKVGVSMSTGDVVFLETRGYLSNHKERAFSSAQYTAEEARETISGVLEVQQVSLALIPKNGGEIRCYEFLCKGEEDRDVLVYVNVTNLNEEDILILLKSDGGTLAK